jgi:hypothetical protein
MQWLVVIIELLIFIIQQISTRKQMFRFYGLTAKLQVGLDQRAMAQ